MANERDNALRPMVLVASLVNHWPVAPRMAMRFAQAGCRVAALYPSGAHPLAITQAVATHYRFSIFHPHDSLLSAICESGAQLIVPCDEFVVRALHDLHAALPHSPVGAAIADVIVRSLGDSTAYLVVGSRHEVLSTARDAGLDAAESFAMGKTASPDVLSQSYPFPWILKSDPAAVDGLQRTANTLPEAQKLIHESTAPPGLLVALREWAANADRSGLVEWIHATPRTVCAQYPVGGRRATVAASCWRGELASAIPIEIEADAGFIAPARARIVECESMLQTAGHLAQRLGLSGFYGFDFMLEPESGRAMLVDLRPHCVQPCHLNAGPGRDPVAAFVGRWLGTEPAPPPPHTAPEIAFFPQAWAANPTDPILTTEAHDIPTGDAGLVKRMQRLARRQRRWRGLQPSLGA